jgi:hypothetical protein
MSGKFRAVVRIPFAVMRAFSARRRVRRVVSHAAVLLVLLTAVVSGCDRSRGSDERRFAIGTRAACTSYGAEMTAISRREHTDPDKARPAAAFQAERRWLEQLRQLVPPSSTGVTVSEWTNAVDVQLRDVRAAIALYGKEFTKLVRSWKRPLPTPKLPPGTGPTAATLAEAFNSPEGRRFLRLQTKLFKQMQTDAPGWERMLKTVGLLKACLGATTQTPGTTAQATTTTRR